jgi:peptidoglycan/LPS O-acetylase OafA/YrhL
MIYHFAPTSMTGGFLGVDIFFVISGYLITRLLAEEFLRNGRINVPQFYLRRARRLLPALALVLVTVSVGALIWRDQLATIRGGVLATAVFGGNWWLAFDHQPYFVSTGRPSMLQHLWSLGVEEQFYLLWPVIVAATLAAGIRAAARRGLSPRQVVSRLSLIALTLSVVSTGLTWLLADLSDVPYGSDGSTLYYGTDTHCMGLLLGAALGAWAAAGVVKPSTPDKATITPQPLVPPRWTFRAIETSGVIALVLLLVFMLRLASYSHTLYRGDFFAVSALVVVVIAVATRRNSIVGRVLDIRPLRWIGVRSYGLYLWHWPIAIVSRPGIDTTMPVWIDQIVRVTLTVVVAAASYRFLESPIRRRGFRAASRAAADQIRTQWRLIPPRLSVTTPVALATLTCLAAFVIVAGPAAPKPSAALDASQGGRDLTLTPNPQPSAIGPTDPTGGAKGSTHPTALPKLSGFGDSVMLGARHALGQLFPGGSLDAVVSRLPDPILADVRSDARSAKLEPLVVLDVGNNGLIDPAELQRTMSALSGARLVLVLTLHLDPYDHSWQKPDNATIKKVVPKFANARIVDWNSLAGQHPGWLYPDDLHLRPSGAIAYAKLIAASYRTDVRQVSG